MKTYHYIVYGLLLGVQSIQSQDFGFDDDVQDVPAAPIDDWVFGMVLAAVLLYMYKKYHQCKQNA
jgi:hypothetical protein